MKRLVLMIIGGLWSLQAAAGTATVLQFREREPGLDPYVTRMLITGEFVRVDEGDDQGGYVLFDRAERTLYNIMHENRAVLIVRPDLDSVPGAPVPELRREPFPVPDAPAIAGHAPMGYRLMAGDAICSETIVVPGLLPEAAAAMVEFHSLLGKQSLSTLENTPVEMRTPCFLARHVLAPAWQWELGFMIRGWDDRGIGIDLLDFRERVPVQDSLFEVPADYEEQRFLLQ